MIDRKPAVHALDHARVGVTHHWRDEVRRGALGAQPGGAGAAQVVGGAVRDARALAGAVEVAPDVDPGREERVAGPLGVLERVLKQRALVVGHDGHHAVARDALGAADEHLREVGADVLAASALALAPVGAGRDDERDARGVVGRQLGEQPLRLLVRERAFFGLVLGGEAGGHDGVDVALPDAGTLRELERRTQRDQLLVDRVLGGAFATPGVDELVNVARVQLGEREGLEVAGAVRLKDARPVPGLGLVEGGRALALAARLGLRLPVAQQQVERGGQGRFRRGRVIGIGLVTLPLPCNGLGCFLVRAAGAALEAPAAHADVGVPDVAAFVLVESHPKTSWMYRSQMKMGTRNNPRPVLPEARRKW